MSQLTDTEPVATLAAALGTPAPIVEDPDATVPVPIVVLGKPTTAAKPEPILDPLRAATVRAHAAAAKIWAEAPMPDNISVHRATQFCGAHVDAYLHQDTDLSRLGAYVEQYEGERTDREHQRPGGRPPAVYSEYLIRIDGVRVCVWTLNEPAQAQS